MKWRPHVRLLIEHALPWLLLIVACTMVFTQVKRPALLLSVLVPWAEVGVLAIAMTAIILTGGIDLSVGSTVALCGVVVGVLWQDCGVSIELAAMCGVTVGIAAGAFNGLLVIAGLPPLVTTLATMAFFRGLAMKISGAERVTGCPPSVTDWRLVAGQPIQFWLLIAVAAIGVVVVHNTTFGRRCYAIGENRLAARYAAIPVKRTDCLLYTASGLAAGLVAVTNAARHNVAVPDAAQGIELQAIACVVVGGTLITGGHGGVHRTLLGLAVISLLDTGLQFLSTRVSFLTAESRLIVVGVLLISVTVWNERVRRRA